MAEEETEEEKTEEESEEEPEEMEEEIEEEVEEETEFSSSEVTGVPIVLCPDDYVPMDIKGTESREVEERSFIFSTSTEDHLHVKFECPECGKAYFHDLDRKRQGCFIATAAYGTPLSSEINVLRNFRDSYLVRRDWGKGLVSLYYTISPPIAKQIEKSESMRKLVRTCLKPVIQLFKDEE